MRLSCFLLFFLVFIHITFAQINEGAFDDYIYFVNQNRPKYEGVEGSPYLTEDFVPTTINDNKSVVFVRFNVYSNAIELKRPDGEIVILSQAEDYRLKLVDGSNKEYESHFFLNDKGKKIKTFFEKVHLTDKYTLFFKENVKYTPKKLATSGFEQNQPAKFTEGKGIYYVSNFSSDTSELTRVPTNKKGVAELFKDKSIQQQIKKQKLKLYRTEDLIKLFDFYFNKEKS